MKLILSFKNLKLQTRSMAFGREVWATKTAPSSPLGDPPPQMVVVRESSFPKMPKPLRLRIYSNSTREKLISLMKRWVVALLATKSLRFFKSFIYLESADEGYQQKCYLGLLFTCQGKAIAMVDGPFKVVCFGNWQKVRTMVFTS